MPFVLSILVRRRETLARWSGQSVRRSGKPVRWSGYLVRWSANGTQSGAVGSRFDMARKLKYSKGKVAFSVFFACLNKLEPWARLKV
jgi:hypothetical protein